MVLVGCVSWMSATVVFVWRGIQQAALAIGGRPDGPGPSFDDGVDAAGQATGGVSVTRTAAVACPAMTPGAVALARLTSFPLWPGATFATSVNRFECPAGSFAIDQHGRPVRIAAPGLELR
jgi:hypothetical protein